MSSNIQAARVDINGAAWLVDLTQGASLARAIDFESPGLRCFAVPAARSEPFVNGGFNGRVTAGASCNCSTISLTPHGNGTHTEGVGHLTAEALDAQAVVPRGLLPALLLSLTPERAADSAEGSVPAPQPQDLLITRTAIANAWSNTRPAFAPQALVLRTLPTETRNRMPVTAPGAGSAADVAAFLSQQAAALLVERGIEHLVLDVPSADRSEDGGLLTAHRIFFGLPAGSTKLAQAVRSNCTITELAFIDDSLADGSFLLALQIPAIAGDAVPSRPLLYRMRRE